MTYNILEGDGTLVVRMQGRLDSTGTPQVEAGLEGRLDDVTSMGLRLLLALQKRMYKQGTMRVTNVCDEVMDLFDDTGFSQLMTVVPAE